MEIKKHDNKKKIIIAVVIVIVVAAITTGVWLFTRPDNNHNQKGNETTQDDKDRSDKDNGEDSDSDSDADADDSADQTDEQSDDQTADNDPTNGGKTPPRYEGGAIQDSETLTGDISGINLVNGNLSIRVTVNQYINDPDGRCDLVLTDPSGNTHTFWSDLIANPQTSTCYGWDITADDLGGNIANGHWKASVTVTGDNRTGIFTKEVDL